MSASSQHKLIGFIHPIGQGQSFLTPLFLAANNFWVQDISEDNRIIGFSRIVLAGYIFPFKDDLAFELGAPALFAFYTGGGTVLSGSKEKLSIHLLNWNQLSQASNAIKISIADFTGHHDLLAHTGATQSGEIPVIDSKNSSLAPIMKSSLDSMTDMLSHQTRLLEAAIQNVAWIMQIGSTTAQHFYLDFGSLIETQRSILESFRDLDLRNSGRSLEEDTAAAIESALAAASNAYESVRRAAKQTSDIAGRHFSGGSSTALPARKAAARRKVSGE